MKRNPLDNLKDYAHPKGGYPAGKPQKGGATPMQKKAAVKEDAIEKARGKRSPKP